MGICSFSQRESPLKSKLAEDLTRSSGTIRTYFILIKSLGSGSFGNVFLVKDKKTGLERAAKELIKANFTEELLGNFYSELTALRNLDHPGIMKVYEVLETSSRLYIITEYLSGGQLLERLSRSERLSEKQIAKYFFSITLSLNYCHKNGLIHKDIKPENLLFENEAPDAHVKLIDFAFSCLKSTTPGEAKGPIGSVCYMAPEKFSGEMTEKSDVWSLGVLLFVILSGKVPFIGKTDAETKKRIIEKPLMMSGKAWDTISDEAKELVQSMLNKDPALRPTVEDILMHPWMYSYTKNSIADNQFHIESVSNLVKFHAKSKLEKTLFTFISSNINSKKEDAKLSELFIRFDKNGDGSLSSAEINEGYDYIGTPPPPPVMELLKKLNLTGATIHYKDFLTFIQNWNKEMQFKELENNFKTYDKGGDGKMSLDELQETIPGVQDSDWAGLLSEADLNGDGMVTLEELKGYIMSRLR